MNDRDDVGRGMRSTQDLLEPWQEAGVNTREDGQDLRYFALERRPKRDLSPLQRSCRALAVVLAMVAAYLLVCWFLTLGPP